MPATDPTDRAAAEEPRWLGPTERAAWLRLLALTARLPTALDAELQRDAGLTLFEYTVLAGLSEQPDRTLRMSRLAGLAQGSLSRLSHVASKLERLGLIVREPCQEDGRYINAIITDAGVARISAAAPHHVATARALVIDVLTPAQLEQLTELAGAVLARIDPDAPFLVDFAQDPDPREPVEP